ncbi:GNAT family N-acetyltransferase [Rhodococcus sp. Q]|uniref:GNAT family N-acetyltransferase n=1 Tax=Rhodococcus sp. Q TaxID=2502252 RepID=UPI0010F7E206|nr:GNAT family N-acetyltransferase [Rhodococcus sp. Q]
MSHRIEHLPENNRFELLVDNKVAAYAEYSEHHHVRDFDHTVTEDEFRGQGLAGALVAAALDTTRAEGLKIRTSCSYVNAYVAKHPEYQDLVA